SAVWPHARRPFDGTAGIGEQRQGDTGTEARPAPARPTEAEPAAPRGAGAAPPTEARPPAPYGVAEARAEAPPSAAPDQPFPPRLPSEPGSPFGPGIWARPREELGSP
ncbi:hypothetical protein AB0G07_18040, partial [Micromonospora tulbaghiae]